MTVKTLQAPPPKTFCRMPASGEPVFKSQGNAVAAGDIVRLIEVTRSFTLVASMSNEDTVMAGQPLRDLDI